MYEKGVPLMIGEREYYLVFSLAAMAQIADKFGGVQEMLDVLQPPEIEPEDTEEVKKGKTAQISKAQVKIMLELPWLIAVMANQGAILHNIETRSKKVDNLTADLVGAMLSAKDMQRAVTAFRLAIEKGSAMEHEDAPQDEVVDLVLKELDEKNASGAGR